MPKIAGCRQKNRGTVKANANKLSKQLRNPTLTLDGCENPQNQARLRMRINDVISITAAPEFE
jgi:hypothetical protein